MAEVKDAELQTRASAVLHRAADQLMNASYAIRTGEIRPTRPMEDAAVELRELAALLSAVMGSGK